MAKMKLFGAPVGKCLLAAFLVIIIYHVAVSACSSIEGFGGAALGYKMGQGVTLGGGGKPWNQRSLGSSQQQSQQIGSYKLPPTQMAVLDGLRFAPECCPNTYSNSTGCVCAPKNLVRYIAAQRGGNHTKSCSEF